MAIHGGSCSEKFPEYGAIFLSNRRTKRECLERQLFGLPPQFVDFVKNIRAGMILFLFEHEKRELHGVFEAISDGGENIVPHAYHSSGRTFPAQAQIRVMWKCDPLSESCFRHVIEENYYAHAPYKFSFGLSREQVHRLLLLFDVRRVGPQKSLEEKVKRRHSRSLDKKGLSIEPGNQIMANMPNCTSQKFQSPNAQMSNYKSGNTSPRSEFLQPQGKIKQIDIPESHLMDLGDYIPLFSPGEQNEHEGDLDHKPRVKGLYSDTPEKRRSVFSRLKLSLQGTTEQEEDNCGTLELTESVEKVMQNLQRKHDNWVRMRKKGDTRTFQNIDNPMRQRSSVFSRLNFTSEATGKNTRTDNSRSCNSLDDLSRRNEKRKHAAAFTDHGNGQCIGMTVSSACQRSVFSRLSLTAEVTGKNTRTGNSCGTTGDVSKGKEETKYAASLTDHGNSQCINMSVQVNMLENRLAIAEAPIAKGITENENGSFGENVTLPAVTSVPYEPRSGKIEKCATDEETKLREIYDAIGVHHKSSKPKIFITYKRRGRCLSASSLDREPAETNTSDQGEMQL